MKVFHGPATVGGIGWHLAEWQKDHSCISDCIVYSDKGNRQLYNLNLNSSRYSIGRRILLELAFFVFCLVRYDIFHFYSGRTFLPFAIDLPILKVFGKKMVMTYCGTDIRLIKVNALWNENSSKLRLGRNHPKFDRSKRIMMWWHNIWIDKFFAIRELRKYAENNISTSKLLDRPWVNNIGFDSRDCIDLSSIKTNEVPIIVHAPSSKGIKGSHYVSAAIDELHRRQLDFHYHELHGIPNSQVQDFIKESDIVVDQFMIAEIGTFAFEGMGLGKPVVSYLPTKIVDQIMPDCPVYNSTPALLADRLEELIKNPQLRLDLGKKGIDFVAKNLDYQSIQQSTLEIYKLL